MLNCPERIEYRILCQQVTVLEQHPILLDSDLRQGKISKPPILA